MRTIRTWLTRACIAFAVAVMGFVGLTQPASAASISDIQIVNSSTSSGNIRIYKTDNSWSMTLTPGQVSPWVNDTGSNPIRVQIYCCGRYWIGIEGQGYGQCHDAPNGDSNPPSGEYPRYVKYKFTDYGSCL